MTAKPKRQKKPVSSRAKTAGKALDAPVVSQKHVRNSNVTRLDYAPVKNNLSQMVANLMVENKRVQAYQNIAESLSKLSGLNGHAWGWRYVASVMSGSTLPSQKFMDAVELYMQDFDPHKKQWFYFAHRKTLASVYNKSIMAEIIKANMRNMGYKLVSYTRYMQVKKSAIRKGR